MRDGGNAKARICWEQNVPALYRRSRVGDLQVMREQWIRAKYERREFVGDEAASVAQHQYMSGLKDGFLWKKGKDNNKWNKRWFVLRDQTLTYFINQRDSQPKERLELANLIITLRSEQMTNPYGLQLSHTRGSTIRNYFVCADSGQVRAGRQY